MDIASSSDGETKIFLIEDRAVKFETEECFDPMYRLKKGWNLRFQKGPSVIGKKIIRIHTDIPQDLTLECEDADLSNLEDLGDLKWLNEEEAAGDESLLYAEAKVKTAGCFNCWSILEMSDGEEDNEIIGPFLVDPVLTVGSNDEVLPLDSIACQSYWSPSLGPIEEWEKRLTVAKESGYNMIHISALQEMSDNTSPYCIKNYNNLNPIFNSGSSECTLKDVEKLVKKMKSEWKILTISDLVLGYVASDAQWINSNPDCVYNMQNSPRIRPVYLIDRVFWHLMLDIADGKWESKGIPKTISDESHLQNIQSVLNEHYFPELKLYEFLTIDVDAVTDIVTEKLIENSYEVVDAEALEMPLELSNITRENDPNYRRLKCSVDVDFACTVLRALHGSDIDKCGEVFRARLEELNEEAKVTMQKGIEKATDVLLKTIRSERIDPNGPNIKEVSKEHPLMHPYILHHGPDLTLAEEEELSYGDNNCYIMVHNGLQDISCSTNFFLPYHTNEIWPTFSGMGDGVILRWCAPVDNPHFWNQMTKYVESIAQTFHGVRMVDGKQIDEIAMKFVIDIARRVKPDFFVIIEIPEKFVDYRNSYIMGSGGFNSVIHEAANAKDAAEESRLVNQFGGRSIGSPETKSLQLESAKEHAMLCDSILGGPAIIQDRSVYDILPTSAILSMACNSGTGSVRGYDELVPHKADLTETRLYSVWSQDETSKNGSINAKSGIIAAKKALNSLHFELGANHFDEVDVECIGELKNIVAVTRRSLLANESIVMLAHTAFKCDENEKEILSYSLSGEIKEIILEAALMKTSDENYAKNETFINGRLDYRLDFQEHIQINESKLIESEESQRIRLKNFLPGSVIAIRFSH